MSGATEAPIIVLVRPQLGENIGKAARAMLNFGLTEMRLVEPFLLDAALAASEGDRLLELAAVERLALAVALDHGDVAQLDALESGEAGAAAFALAAAADRRVVLGRAAVLYLGIVMRAERTAHRSLLDAVVEREARACDEADRPCDQR